MLYKKLGDDILKSFYKVYNTLGYGFLEKVYENAMVMELNGLGLETAQQVGINVYYRDKIVGNYYADLLVDKRIILELKSCESLPESHEAQLLNYLKATSIELGYLLNFGKTPEFRRKLFTNDYK